MAKLTDKLFFKAVMARVGDTEGVTYAPVRHLKDGRDLCIVFGYTDGYDIDPSLYQQNGLTLCVKLAINIDDLQCDYDIDWFMPWDKDGNVYDSELAVNRCVNDAKWLRDEANRIKRLYDKGILSVK